MKKVLAISLVFFITICLLIPFKLYAYTYDILPAGTPLHVYPTSYYKFNKDVKINTFRSDTNGNLQFQCDTSFSYNIESNYNNSLNNNTYDKNCSTINIYGNDVYTFNIYAGYNTFDNDILNLFNNAINTSQSGSSLSYQGALIYHHDLISPKISHYDGGDIFQSWDTTDPSSPYYISNVDDFYVFAIKNTVYLVSTNQQFTYNRDNNNGTWTGTALTIDNTTYYYYNPNWSYSSSYHYNFTWDTNITTSGSNGLTAFVYICYNYNTPSPPSPGNIYGDLIDVGFYTNFTNSQQSTFSAMKNNKDTIKWNGYQDSLGNSLNEIGFTVDIQAAIVDYEASTKSDLLNQTISDMITGDWTDIISISPNVGEVSFSWENIAQTLLSTNYNLDFWNKLSIFQGYNQQSQLKFMKEGWIYRIRLRNTVDEYVGDWQIVYTLQGAPAGISDGTIQHIYNTNTTIPEQTVYNDCDEINNLNNTTNNWYINDSPMDVTNDNETWVEKLIKFIIGVVDKIAGLIDKLINIILDVFGSILDGLIDLIMSLFGDLDLKDLFFGWFSDLKDYIESIDLTLPVFNLPEMTQVESFNRLVQETMNIFINNDLGFVIFIPLILLIVRLVL